MQVELVADNKHRPQDLRTLALRGLVDRGAASAYALCADVAQAAGEAWAPLLMAGCVIAQEMRAALKVLAGSAAVDIKHAWQGTCRWCCCTMFPTGVGKLSAK